MYKITLETMACNYSDNKSEVVKIFEFATKKEANKALKKIAKEYEMTKSPLGTYWNMWTNKELTTNY